MNIVLSHRSDTRSSVHALTACAAGQRRGARNTAEVDVGVVHAQSPVKADLAARHKRCRQTIASCATAHTAIAHSPVGGWRARELLGAAIKDAKAATRDLQVEMVPDVKRSS